MVQYIFTPWRNRAELLAVRRQFYPRETQPSGPPAGSSSSSSSTVLHYHHQPQQQQQQQQEDGDAGPEEGEDDKEEERRNSSQQAVARVAMWMQRGGCPHMVESTALLTAAGLSDLGVGGEDHHGGGNNGVERAAGGYAVRAAYSAAFSRFVTGLLDSHQDKQRKMSMYDVAKSVGLPATFVELRHQATHEQLPSLTRLRAAARKALAWIWEYYWRHLALDDAEGSQAAPGAVVEGGGQEDGEGSGSGEESAVRGLVVRYLEGDGEEWKGEIGRADEGLVLTVLDSISGSTRDSRVLRRAMALTREILEGGGVADRMDEDDEKPGTEVLMDARRVKAEMGKAREEVNEAEDPRPEDEDEPAEAVMAEQRPAWALYDEEAWVPKPIGVV